MASITLNKPSGGQLTLSPEDGTSNETISITPTGFPKQSGEILQQKTITFDFSGDAGTTSSSWVEIDSGLRIAFTPKESNSTIVFNVSSTDSWAYPASTLGLAIFDINGMVNPFGSSEFMRMYYSNDTVFAPINATHSCPSWVGEKTYSVFGRNGNSTGQLVNWNWYGALGMMTFTVTEVAA